MVGRAGTESKLQDPIRDPACFDWNDVAKAAHYYLSVNAMTQKGGGQAMFLIYIEMIRKYGLVLAPS